jgi:ankyrin repeat protein
MAAQIGSIEGVKALIEAKASIDMKVEGRTALLVSGYKGYIEIFKLLLAAGANPNEKYQDKNISEWISSIEVKAEIKIFNKAPIKYILKGNNDADLALAGLKHIEKFSNTKPSLLEKIYKTEECLEAQNKDVDLDLNALCGESGSLYHSEL